MSKQIHVTLSLGHLKALIEAGEMRLAGETEGVNVISLEAGLRHLKGARDRLAAHPDLYRKGKPRQDNPID